MSLHNAVTEILSVKSSSKGKPGWGFQGQLYGAGENQLGLEAWVGREKGIPVRKTMDGTGDAASIPQW